LLARDFESISFFGRSTIFSAKAVLTGKGVVDKAVGQVVGARGVKADLKIGEVSSRTFLAMFPVLRVCRYRDEETGSVFLDEKLKFVVILLKFFKGIADNINVGHIVPLPNRYMSDMPQGQGRCKPAFFLYKTFSPAALNIRLDTKPGQYCFFTGCCLSAKSRHGYAAPGSKPTPVRGC
jgi:hypothetical protein